MNHLDQYAVAHNQSDLNGQLQAKESVIALFYASWCPFCVGFLPVFEKYANSKAGDFLLVVDDEESMADKYAVDVVPTVLFFKNGAVARRLDGRLGRGLTEKQLADFISQCHGAA